MDIKKISEKGHDLGLFVTGTDSIMMNAIRRTAMNNVSGLAIENVYIYENSSVMPDEMLSHRLGLLPVRGQLAGKETQAKFGLEKEGPAMVYSGDIVATTANAEIADKKIPVVLLGKNQKLRLEIEALAGTGKSHVKWQPGIVSYGQVPKVSFENVKDPESLAKALHISTLDVKAKKAVLMDPASISVATEVRDKHPNEVVLEYDDSAFFLHVETNGGLSNGEILFSAVSGLRERNKEFKESLKNL